MLLQQSFNARTLSDICPPGHFRLTQTINLTLTLTITLMLTRVRSVWQQFSWLNPSVYSAALHGGCCVPPCVADVSIVNCAVCQQFNKLTLL